MDTIKVEDNIEVKYLAWEIQKACNLGCRFCYSSSWNLNREDLAKLSNPSVDDIKKGLNLLKKSELGVEYINWTGGEPLLRKDDLPKILEYSRLLGFKNIISTNSNLSDLNFYSPDKYFEYLDTIADSLDVLSVSLDSSDQETNDQEMRVKYDKEHKFASKTKSAHFQDCKALIEEFKKRRFPFSLKINTLVTKKNKNHLHGFVELLRDVPCIWHLIQFNPRQCPPEAINEFSLGNVELGDEPSKEEIKRRDEAATEEFKTIVMDIEREVELSEKPCKFFITTRLYDGSTNPYCFLVINTDDHVLLPYGEEHKVVGTLPIRTNKNVESPDNYASEWLESLTNSIVKECENATSFKLCETDRKRIIKQFNDSNAKVLARYLHPTAALHHSTESLQILRHCLVTTIQSKKADGIPQQFLAADNLDQMTAPAQALLESPRTGRFLYESFGIVGGTLALLPIDPAQKKRIAPALQKPPGLHVPWCFSTIEDKIKYFKLLFKGAKDDESDLEPDEIIKSRIIPKKFCDEASLDFEEIKKFLRSSENNADSSVFSTLTRATESIVGRLVAHFHSDQDPWAKAFVDQSEQRKAYILDQSDIAKEAVKNWLQANNRHNNVDAIKRRWGIDTSGAPPSTEQSPSTIKAKDSVPIPAALWYFLFDPLLEMGLRLPDVYAFRLAEGSGYVAVASIYLIKEYMTTIGPDESAIGQRMGAFFETLAWPSIVQQMAALEAEMTRVKEQSRNDEVIAGIHKRIEKDLKDLIKASHRITNLTVRIESSMNSSKDSFLRLYDIIGKIFDDQKTLYYPKAAEDQTFQLRSDPVDGWIELKTIHSPANPSNGYNNFDEAWQAYAAFLTEAGSENALNMPFLLDLAQATKVHDKPNPITCFSFLKQIIHRPHAQPSHIYDGQIAFALRLASPVHVDVVYNETKFEKTSDKLQLAAWLKSKLTRGKNTPLYLEGEADSLKIADTTYDEIPRCPEILSALMRFCGELSASDRPCKLQNINLTSNAEGLVVQWKCQGEIPRDAYKLDENSKGRSLRSCLLTLCRACNKNQPEIVSQQSNLGDEGFFILINGHNTTFFFILKRIQQSAAENEIEASE
jgi:MoaA/NifB/PqqE/SkfB family radical SAM enzyme